MPNSKKNTGNDTTAADNKGRKQATAADFEQTAREADAEKKTLKPGQSQGSNTKQHNNGRGGGK